MGRLRNTMSGYGSVSIGLHWLMALAIVAVFAIGIIMHELPWASPLRPVLYNLHKSMGLLVLLVAVGRLIWRWLNPVPALPGDMLLYLRILSVLAHHVLYFLMAVVPFTGWLIVSAAAGRQTTRLFGLIEVPNLPVGVFFAPGRASAHLLEDIHGAAAFAMILLALLHAIAALYHHFYRKDMVLRRMLSTKYRDEESS